MTGKDQEVNEWGMEINNASGTSIKLGVALLSHDWWHITVTVILAYAGTQLLYVSLSLRSICRLYG